MTIETVFWLVGLFGANLAGIVGAFVALKVSMAVLQVKADRLQKDIDSAWERIRELETKT